MSIINDKTGLIFYPNDISNQKMVIEGFVKSNDRNNEIIDIFDKLARTFNISTLIGSDRKIPYLSSGITTKEEFKQMFELINKNVKEPNSYIQNILEILNNAINKTS